jgi:hypothetical protein
MHRSTSRAITTISATSSCTFTLRKNGSNFGTITFSAGSSTGTLAAANNTSFAAGDILTIVNQATADTTLANISMTITTTLV